MPLPPPPPEHAGPAPGSAPLPPPDRRVRRRLADGETPCFRHPNRVGGRRCTRCGRAACPECLVQASVGSHCVECAKAARPDLRTRARWWQASKPAIVAYVLIGLNVAAFVVGGAIYGGGNLLDGSGGGEHLRFALSKAFVDGRVTQVRLPDGSIYVSGGEEWYRLVTSGFLHYGLLHLALNMWFLYLLGNLMEPQLGRGRFTALYLTSLLGGSAGALLIDQGLTAGASGAIFGLLGAYAVGMWQHGVNPFGTQIGTLLLINLGLTFFIGGISIGGHLGGLVAGSLCGFVVLAPGYKGYPRWATWATPAVVSVAAIAVSVIAARA